MSKLRLVQNKFLADVYIEAVQLAETLDDISKQQGADAVLSSESNIPTKTLINLLEAYMSVYDLALNTELAEYSTPSVYKNTQIH